jgi:hypothetical protein
MEMVETRINGIHKVKMTREFAIESLIDCWAEFYSDDHKEAIDELLNIFKKGRKGFDQMTNIELIQELEGSVFYGETVEITLVSKGEE